MGLSWRASTVEEQDGRGQARNPGPSTQAHSQRTPNAIQLTSANISNKHFTSLPMNSRQLHVARCLQRTTLPKVAQTSGLGRIGRCLPLRLGSCHGIADFLPPEKRDPLRPWYPVGRYPRLSEGLYFVLRIVALQCVALRAFRVIVPRWQRSLCGSLWPPLLRKGVPQFGLVPTLDVVAKRVHWVSEELRPDPVN